MTSESSVENPYEAPQAAPVTRRRQRRSRWEYQDPTFRARFVQVLLCLGLLLLVGSTVMLVVERGLLADVDSGIDVTVGARPGGPGWSTAEADGLRVATPAEATAGADVVAMLLPDTSQPQVFKDAVAPNLKEGAMLLFAHGFNVHYGTIELPATADVTMVAPKGPGALVRRQFEQGRGVPCLMAIHQDATLFGARSYLCRFHGCFCSFLGQLAAMTPGGAP